MKKAALLCAFLAAVSAKETTPCTPPTNASGADDGNPHCWDRMRRCDGPNAHPDNSTGYNPPCGLCEGIGGMAWGDKNEEITIPSCKPLAAPAAVEDKPQRPEWGQGNTGKFTVYNDRFIMIGHKRDPFCFKFFPFKDSKGPLCYRRQTGTFYYDLSPDTKTVRYDMNIHIPWPSDNHSLFGNVTTLIAHKGPDMWIVNDLKVMHQCICTRPIPEGYTNLIYPVIWNWTNLLSYVGREEIEVEYGVGLKQLEHWTYGPHHAWTEVGDNKIVRMWQPYNGFEVFPKWEEGVDETKFADITPPAKCKKGGAVMRIGCNDEGYPNSPTPYPPFLGAQTPDQKTPDQLKEEEDWAHATEAPSVGDLRRAKTRVPKKTHKGSDFADMSTKLNGFLRAYKNTKECRDWTAKELQEFQARMLLLRAPELDSVYQAVSDNRRLRGSAEEHGERWERLHNLARKFGTAYEAMHRDGHCHEAVMWFVHHVPEPARRALEDQLSIPLLPYEKHVCPHAFPDQEQKSICDEYIHQVSCADCHSDTQAPTNMIPPPNAPPMVEILV